MSVRRLTRNEVQIFLRVCPKCIFNTRHSYIASVTIDDPGHWQHCKHLKDENAVLLKSGDQRISCSHLKEPLVTNVKLRSRRG